MLIKPTVHLGRLLKAVWDVLSLFLSNFEYEIVSKNYFSRVMCAGLNEF